MGTHLFGTVGAKRKGAGRAASAAGRQLRKGTQAATLTVLLLTPLQGGRVCGVRRTGGEKGSARAAREVLYT